ncbi:hydrolase [Anaerotardibacter muris]|uniref:hydrolase n=1 Tax=Anaerotardibacter muris TaxID=2941505 RepID=UPI00203E1D85|nr:hydrolase [Anaerotardibacter muris]
MKVKRVHIVQLGFMLLVAALLSCCTVFTPIAWADEETDESASDMRSVETRGNTVNVNQMPDSSFLYNTDIAELFDAESFHDTQMVQVRGEVVGDCIADETDGNLCWITLQSLDEDDSSVITVLMSREQAALIDGYGNYDVTGTELQVRGIYYLSCPEHQGLSDLHAQEVTVVANATERDHEGHPGVIWAAILAVGLGLLLLFVYRYMRERSK